MASQVEGIKWIPRTPFLVDGFNFQSPKCQAYFLTHFHSDHTTGLTRSFCRAPIYCSRVTADLLIEDMGMSPQFVRVLPMDKEVTVLGIPVVLLEANHCPGAVLMLFKVPRVGGAGPPEAMLHTGDFRWQPWMMDKLRPHLADCGGRVETLFLDTTYCLPKHLHPPQAAAIASLVKVMRQEVEREPATLFLMAAYHIGKERAFLGAARHLGVKVFCTAAKRRVMAMLDLPDEDMALLSDSEEEAAIHVTNWGLRPEALQRQLDEGGGRWKAVMGVRATGWTMRKQPGLNVWRAGSGVSLVGVPYSEHSSFSELRDCVATLRPQRLVPTVNAMTPAASRTIVDRFADLMDISRDRSRLDWYLVPRPLSGGAGPRGGGAAGRICAAAPPALDALAGSSRAPAVGAGGDRPTQLDRSPEQQEEEEEDEEEEDEVCGWDDADAPSAGGSQGSLLSWGALQRQQSLLSDADGMPPPSATTAAAFSGRGADPFRAASPGPPASAPPAAAAAAAAGRGGSPGGLAVQAGGARTPRTAPPSPSGSSPAGEDCDLHIDLTGPGGGDDGVVGQGDAGCSGGAATPQAAMLPPLNPQGAGALLGVGRSSGAAGGTPQPCEADGWDASSAPGAANGDTAHAADAAGPGPGPGPDHLDLSSIDVREQQRLWDLLCPTSARRSADSPLQRRGSTGAAAGKRRESTGGLGGTPAKRRLQGAVVKVEGPAPGMATVAGAAGRVLAGQRGIRQFFRQG